MIGRGPMASQTAIGVDVGGTKIAAGRVRSDGTLAEHVVVPSPAGDSDAAVEAIVEAINQLAPQADEPVGCAVAGYINAERDMVISSPNMAWRNAPMKEWIASRTGRQVTIDNDANAAAWGEFVAGAGHAVDDMVMLTLGTGVGGGIVIGGRLLRGAHGIAAEIGHMELVPDGRQCGCGKRGCLEQYASGSALGELARMACASQPRQGQAILAAARVRVGADAGVRDITGRDVRTASRNGDDLAAELHATVGRSLGVACADLTAILDPATFVIGGGLAHVGDQIIEPARAAYRTHVVGGSNRPIADLTVASLGNDAGMIGAALLALGDR